GPLLNRIEHLLEARQSRLGCREIGVRLPVGPAEHVAALFPAGRLPNEADVGGGIGLPDLACQNPARLSTARGVARTRHCITERLALAVLRVLRQWTMCQSLLVTQLDAAKIEHSVLHRTGDALAAPR